MLACGAGVSTCAPESFTSVVGVQTWVRVPGRATFLRLRTVWYARSNSRSLARPV